MAALTDRLTVIVERVGVRLTWLGWDVILSVPQHDSGLPALADDELARTGRARHGHAVRPNLRSLPAGGRPQQGIRLARLGRCVGCPRGSAQNDDACLAADDGSHRTYANHGGLRVSTLEPAGAPAGATAPVPPSQTTGRQSPPPPDPIATLIETVAGNISSPANANSRSATSKAPARSSTARSTSCSSPLRRPDRCPPARAFRSPGRSDQRVRGDRARAGRRLRRKEGRAGVDRRAAEDRDLPEAGRRRRNNRGGQGGPRGDRARHSDPAEPACCRTSSCSRAGCATTSRTA